MPHVLRTYFFHANFCILPSIRLQSVVVYAIRFLVKRQGVVGSPNLEDSQNPIPHTTDLVKTQFCSFHHRIKDGSSSTRFRAVHHRIRVGAMLEYGIVCSIELRFGSSRFYLLAAWWFDTVLLSPL
jgi:hypothetical protein